MPDPVTALANDPRLQRLCRLCTALPEVLGSLHEDYADFRVRGKLFAYFLCNHHHDGIVSVCCKAARGENEDRVRHDPRRFYLPAYIGKQGWFGLRLDQGHIDWDEIANLLELSYCLAAPMTLVRQLRNPQESVDSTEHPGANSLPAKVRPATVRPASVRHAKAQPTSSKRGTASGRKQT